MKSAEILNLLSVLNDKGESNSTKFTFCYSCFYHIDFLLQKKEKKNSNNN